MTKTIPVTISMTLSCNTFVTIEEDDNYDSIEDAVNDQIVLPNENPYLGNKWTVDEYEVIQEETKELELFPEI